MLKALQRELPKLWTDELYSEQFRASPSKYKDFQHALLHVRKATSGLDNMVEASDHGGEHFPAEDVAKYISDLVICAVRLALTVPGGPLDLEDAIRWRLERKMGVKLEPEDWRLGFVAELAQKVHDSGGDSHSGSIQFCGDQLCKKAIERLRAEGTTR